MPGLADYSLQLFGVVGLLYFLLKKLSRGKAWHILPATMSLETALATIAFLLLVGATGNTASWFYPLTYIHLFFVIFSSHVTTSIVVTLLIMLFHYGLSPSLVQHELISLATLPIVMVFFIFAKLQHEEVVADELIIEEEEEKLARLEAEEFQAENFLQHYLQPKLNQIERLLVGGRGGGLTGGRGADGQGSYGRNFELIQAQIKAMQIEVERILERLTAHEVESDGEATDGETVEGGVENQDKGGNKVGDGNKVEGEGEGEVEGEDGVKVDEVNEDE